ncbi:hypothetical protein [Wolbachia endosymbiont (group A) of Nomada hirtipes]|uniref:hypothetical protein n=1 Tax=Wolbachia endosymbiont (group A) of Nomada hirtipes TaxID=3066208 RepID=UPI0030D2ABE3
MLLLYHSHKHISYPIRTIARSAIYDRSSNEKLDSSVSYLHDKKRSAGMTSSLVEIALKSQCP